MQVSKIGLKSSYGSVGLKDNMQQNQNTPYADKQISMKGGGFFAWLISAFATLGRMGFRIL